MNKVEDVNFTPKVKRLLDIAKQKCLSHNYVEIDESFMLYALLLSQSMIVDNAFEQIKVLPSELVNRLEKELPEKKRKKVSVDYTDAVIKIIKESYKISRYYNQNYTGVEHLFLSMLRHSSYAKKFFKSQGVDIIFLSSEIESGCKTVSNPTKKLSSTQSSSSSPSLLKDFCINFTEKAENGEFDNACFRDAEVAQVSEVLCRKQKRNPILVGEAGVGKSTIIGLLAKKIMTGESTEFLLGKTIMQLDMTAMVAGTNLRGQFEERLHKVLKEVKDNKSIILFIDEIHTIIGLGNDEGSLDTANILKPYLATDEISCIGATTQKEYEQYFQKDSAMNRRFEPVFVKEPSKEDTLKILKSIKPYYEEFHKIRFPDETLSDIIELCAKYIPNRRFPDKAIDILDQVGAKVKIKTYARSEEIKKIESMIADLEQSDDLFESEESKNIQMDSIIKDYKTKFESWMKLQENKKVTATRKDVYQVLCEKVGSIIDTNAQDSNFRNIHNELKKHVFGQDAALKKISDCILRSSFGLSSTSKPLGSFMFVGPTGSGKTHLAKVLSKQAFGGEDSLVRIDMSEFMEPHSVSKLIGSPPGYVGHGKSNIFSNQLEKRPSTIFLFDEIEKAHPDVINILLQVMDNGELSDSNGRKLNFKNCILIMTGNVGFQFGDNKQIGFCAPAEEVISKEGVQEKLKRFFRPEFLARLNDVIIFDHLKEESLIKIAETELESIKASLKANDTSVSFSKDVVNFIISKTKDSKNGARGVIFFIENELKTKIVDSLACSSYNQIKVKIKDNEIQVNGTKEKLLTAHSSRQHSVAN
jgi:ATP-dependent Clp protease ATP-binding subunit ClpC